MKLYGSYTSPFVRHCRVALIQSDFDFEFIEADSAASAKDNPTQKVPYFSDGDLKLSDSSSIIKHVREKSGKTFLADIQDYDLFAMVNTVLDSTINLFLMEKDGYVPKPSQYLDRQSRRISSGLAEINRRIDPEQGIATDSALRCACYVDWAIFRNRANFSDFGNLTDLLDIANQKSAFTATAIPR